MAISTVGFDNADITEAGFARLMAAIGDLDNVHGVGSGMVVTPGTGTRGVQVSAGEAMAPGVLVTSDAPVTLTHPANTSGGPRTDYVVLSVDWTANTATFTVVQGSSVAPPALTQTAGSVWQIPLARVTVAAGATAITAAAITVCKPIPRRTQVYRASVAGATLGAAAPAAAIASVAVPDPGWPYRLLMVGSVRFASSGSGYGQLQVDVDTTTVQWAVSSRLDLGGPQPGHVSGTSEVLTGPRTAALRVVAFAMNAGDSLVANASGMNQFTVHQIPA